MTTTHKPFHQCVGNIPLEEFVSCWHDSVTISCTSMMRISHLEVVVRRCSRSATVLMWAEVGPKGPKVFLHVHAFMLLTPNSDPTVWMSRLNSRLIRPDNVSSSLLLSSFAESVWAAASVSCSSLTAVVIFCCCSPATTYVQRCSFIWVPVAFLPPIKRGFNPYNCCRQQSIVYYFCSNNVQCFIIIYSLSIYLFLLSFSIYFCWVGLDVVENFLSPKGSCLQKAPNASFVLPPSGRI